MDRMKCDRGSFGTRAHRGAANKTVVIVLIVLLVVALLACGICGGVGWFGWNFSQQVMGEQLKSALQGNAAVAENLGEIERCSLNFTATAEVTQSAGGAQRLAFDVVGSLGDGVIIAEQDPSNPQKPLAPIELRMSSGERFDLTGAAKEPTGDLEGSAEAAGI